MNGLPPEWPEDVMPSVRGQLQSSPRKLVVLDDDPTGTQTVHDIAVLTEWTVDALARELRNDAPAFYLLTNSRSLTAANAASLNREIAGNLVRAAQQTRQDFAVVSRSDSTLRGHFPGEVEALATGLKQSFDGWLIIPFFIEGGRYTINDVHYVAEGEALIPAGETPFAQDAAFGYRASNLRDWVAEKTGGRIPADTVASISLEDIRRGGPDAAYARLMELSDGRVCVVNAASMRDMQVLVAGLLRAETAGKRYLYRTAASFVQARAGLETRPLLIASDLSLPATGGGLVIVGSYVPKTTRQVEALLSSAQITAIEVSCEELLNPAQRQAAIEAAAASAELALARNADTVIYTSRALITISEGEASLAVGSHISSGLISILRQINARPRYLLAKGGITSSDVATRGLDVKRALVRGQILPGVPVWQLGEESRYPTLAYIVFPGNVGGDNALATVVQSLAQGGA
ncbi:MAG: hypothetical protein KJ065_15480 [Anaerolineae bacterium]|nr:hypothetical protein [Anaerolineae bacterium]